LKKSKGGGLDPSGKSDHPEHKGEPETHGNGKGDRHKGRRGKEQPRKAEGEEEVNKEKSGKGTGIYHCTNL
jgi:hypothetical protein